MVHGNFYGVQYEIYLNQPIDFYDDLLPIWTDVRERIEMEQDKHSGKYKLVVIPHQEYDKQLCNNSLFRNFIQENDSKCETEQDVITKKFVMVTQYIRYVKHHSNLPEPLTEEEYNELLEHWRKLNEQISVANGLSNKEWIELEEEQTDVLNRLKVQRIIHNPHFFEEIEQLEKELLNQVHITESQQQLIQKVLTHKKLEGFIEWHGLSLISGFY